MEKIKKLYLDGIIPLCPVCGRELEEAAFNDSGWQCRCGEFIPGQLALNPREGCTHGRNCNCNRSRTGAK